MAITNTQRAGWSDLMKQIEDELSDDLDRYDGEWEVWSEVVMDCPSNTLEKLFGQIPEKYQEHYMRQVSKMVQDLRPEE